MHVLLTLAATVSLGSPTSAAGEGWARFHPEGVPVSMSMPHTPRHARQVTDTAVGDVETLVWELIDPREQFAVTVTELPRPALWFCSRDALMRRAFEQLLAKIGGLESAVSPGRGNPDELEMRYSIVVDGRRVQGRARAALVGRNLVVVNVVAEGSRAARFLSSVVVRRDEA